ncbi:glycosyltransferase family 2 protein [Psychromonas sp. psych-6C06]|uniref:glycosyltransferase family 2 protein n=1 Tax=Psychromonas sp. psych-6C06 TaxID=2058089 RepID=UPI000C341205|nr:glycosyltransferase family 2 protein [Psychromonas sp. psych-6C06]PKF62489.1 glycosyltransferase family 2 protein [Psychromonas sp. psych-6C06]
MSNLLLIVITLGSGLLVIYHHIGYPLMLRLLAKQRLQTKHKTEPIKGDRHYTDSDEDAQLADIAIVMPAYNEAQWIAEKIRNLAALDYPASHLQIIIGCDGCSDDTFALATSTAKEPECAHLNINIIEFKENRGKVALLNDLLSNIDCELVALTDTSALLSIDALLVATQRFNDPNIGVLNGHYRVISPGSQGEQTYWDYQSQIKLSEAALGSTLGAHGAFYMFRYALFEPLASDTINDDFILPMKIVAAGYRADYEQAINALELESADNQQDHHRRRRIAAGNLQQLLRLKALLLPRYKGVAFSFISGKALRVLMPFLMLSALLGSLILASQHVLFLGLAIAQLTAYCMAAWQLIFKPQQSNKASKLLAYLVSGHCAGLIGSVRYLLRLDKGHWHKVNSSK